MKSKVTAGRNIIFNCYVFNYLFFFAHVVVLFDLPLFYFIVFNLFNKFLTN